MPLQLYHFHISPPSRSVLMTLKALGIDFEVKPVNLFEGEQKKTEYLKINPRGKVPALMDGNVNVYESRAIATYLCNKYAKGAKQSLYPSDPDERVQVDIMLYATEWMFDEIIGYLNAGGVFFRGEKTNEEKLPQVKEVLTFLENVLKKKQYVAADRLTIADFFAVTTVLFLDGALYKDYDAFPSLVAWMERMKSLPYFEECNKEPMKMFVQSYQDKISPKKQTAF